MIIKPSISATAFNTFRLADFSGSLEVFADESYLVQPFVSSVIENGEFSLFFFNGEFSHSVQKTPKSGDFRVQEDFGGQIVGITPSVEMLDLGESVIAVLNERPLYARVDFVLGNDGKFRVMELELIEPALYFRCVEESANRFAKALSDHLNEL